MIVWGGFNATAYLNTGGRYNPGTEQLDSHQHHQRARCADIVTRQSGPAAK